MAFAQIQNITIRIATQSDLGALWEMSAILKQSKDTDYFEQQLAYQERGTRMVLLAHEGMHEVGYCVLNWQPKYGYFKAHNIPEIQDLNVLQDYRKHGIATRMIDYCEKRAAEKGHDTMGISFGLNSSFGPAQRLYVKLGYIPDGHGVTYDRKVVQSGEFKPVDDQLCLMLTKNLKNKG